jgi:hypothetical protein
MTPNIVNRNPAQRGPLWNPRPIPADPASKHGPGALYTQAASAGPNREEPEVNAAAQSAVSDAAHGSQQVRSESTNARVIDRASLKVGQDNASNYGNAGAAI